MKAEILDFDFADSGFSTSVAGARPTNSRVSVPQSLTLYNDFMYTSRIRRLWQNDTTGSVYSSDNRMLISLWLKYNAGHRGFRLRYSSDEPTICMGNLNSEEGIIESPRNISTYFCEYQRDPSIPLLREGSDVGTMGIYITESALVSLTYCHLISPIHVQYLPFTRIRIFTKQCNTTNEFPPVASPFSEVKIGTKKGGYHSEVAPYTISYKIHNCGSVIKNTQESTIRKPIFPQNYGRVACAWQYETIENSPISVSLLT